MRKPIFLFCLLLCLASCKKEAADETLTGPEFQGHLRKPLVSMIISNRDGITDYLYDSQGRLERLFTMEFGKFYSKTLQYFPGRVYISYFRENGEELVLLGDNALLASVEYNSPSESDFGTVTSHAEATYRSSADYNTKKQLMSAHQLYTYNQYCTPENSGYPSSKRQEECTEAFMWNNDGNLASYNRKFIATSWRNGIVTSSSESNTTSVFSYTNYPNPTYICFNLYNDNIYIATITRHGDLGLMGNICPYIPEYEDVTISTPNGQITIRYKFICTFTQDGVLESLTRQSDDPDSGYKNYPITWTFTYYN